MEREYRTRRRLRSNRDRCGL